MKRSDCILVYGSTTKGDVMKRSGLLFLSLITRRRGVKSISGHLFKHKGQKFAPYIVK